MSLSRLTVAVRVLVFYFTALLLLLLVGGVLQTSFGLAGVIAMQAVIFAGLPVVFTRLVERRPVQPFLRLRMLGARGLIKAVILGAVCWLGAQVMGSLVVLFLKQVGGEMFQPYDLLLNAPAGLALVAGALIPAICEELSFRGYVLGALRPLGPTAAVFLTGLLFGALHLSLVRLIPLSILGMLWAIAVQRSGSVMTGMILHFMNNAIALGLTFFVQKRANPASVAALDQFPPGLLWVAIGVLAVMSFGFVVAAYFIAASFNPSDLRNPSAAIAGEAALKPSPAAEFDWTSLSEAPSEIRSLGDELAGLQKRRRAMLAAVAVTTGLLTLAVYGWAVWNELHRVFG